MSVIEVHATDLPIRVDPGGTKHAVARVFLEDSGFRGPALFTLINPSVRLDTYASTRNVGQIQVVNPNAKDEDGDHPRLAYLEFDSLRFQHAYDSIYKFRGWLVEARAYNPTEPLPYSNEEVWPFLPPQCIELRSNYTPYPVTVEVCYATEQVLNEWLDIIEG